MAFDDLLVCGACKRRVYAVLGIGAITTPPDAVRAAIVVEHRDGRNGASQINHPTIDLWSEIKAWVENWHYWTAFDWTMVIGIIIFVLGFVVALPTAPRSVTTHSGTTATTTHYRGHDPSPGEKRPGLKMILIGILVFVAGVILKFRLWTLVRGTQHTNYRANTGRHPLWSVLLLYRYPNEPSFDARGPRVQSVVLQPSRRLQR